MHSKQLQIQKLLVERYGFVFKQNVAGAIGTRAIFVHLYGLEASVSEYRVCFYGNSISGGDSADYFPAKNKPRCFDADQKSQIKAYLEQTIALRGQPA